MVASTVHFLHFRIFSYVYVIVCISQALHEEETELQANQKVLVRDEEIGRMAIDMEATQAQMNHAIRHATRQNSIMDRVLWAALFRAFPWTLGIHGTQVVCMLDVKWFSLIPAGWRPDKLPAHRYQSHHHPSPIQVNSKKFNLKTNQSGKFSPFLHIWLGFNQV